LLVVVVVLIIMAIVMVYLRGSASTAGSAISSFNLSESSTSSTSSKSPTYGMQQKICRERQGVRFLKSHEELMGAMDCSNPINETVVNRLPNVFTHHNVPTGSITVISSYMYVKEDVESKWSITELKLWSNAAEIEIDGQIVAAVYFSGDGKVANYVGNIQYLANNIYVRVMSSPVHLSKGWHELVIRFQTHSGNYLYLNYYLKGDGVWYQYRVGQNSPAITFYT